MVEFNTMRASFRQSGESCILDVKAAAVGTARAKLAGCAPAYRESCSPGVTFRWV